MSTAFDLSPAPPTAVLLLADPEPCGPEGRELDEVLSSVLRQWRARAESLLARVEGPTEPAIVQLVPTRTLRVRLRRVAPIAPLPYEEDDPR